MKLTLQKSWRRLASLFLCMFLLTGCQAAGGESMGTAANAAGEDVEPLQAENEIPKDGMISQAQMATISGKDGVYYFNGETEDGIDYQWAYDGKKVQNPIEQNLKVETTSDGLEEIQKAASNAPYGLGVTLQKMELATPATLTLTLPEAWDADRVLYCTYEDGTIYQLAQAEIAQVKNGKQEVSELSVTVSKAGDTFYFLGGSSQGAKTQNGGKSAKNDKAADKAEGSTSAETTKTPDAASGTQTHTSTEGHQNEASGTDDNQQPVQGDESGDQQNPDPGGDAQQPEQDFYTAQNPQGGEENPDNNIPDSGQTHTCTFSIECSTLVGNPDLKSGKAEFVPADGWILPASQVEFTPGETVFDVLKRVCEQGSIQMESSYTPIYGSYYIEGINQLYEFDGGGQSGWQYCVNGWFPNYGCSSYSVEDGDIIEWKYTCNLGSDVGNTSMGGES